MHIIRIPQASENLEAATIGKWLKAEGEPVEAGEPVVELLTDKADFALEAEESGWLRRVTVAEKSTVPVGYAIGIIAGLDEPLPDVSAENARLLEAFKPAAARPAEAAATRKLPPTGGPRIPATPAARRIAKEHGVDLAEVGRCLGKVGIVSADDVEEFMRKMGRLRGGEVR